MGSPAAAAQALPASGSVADLTFAGLYLPAGPGPEPIAGDFWDVLPVAGGLVSLLVGDVAGHGEGAESRMRALRFAARACALVDARPASVLGRLDTIMQALGPEELATLWCGLYDPRTGALVYSSAGHPPPALRRPGGPCRPLALADAPPLGTGVVGRAPEHMGDLAPGAVLVAYSDGLIERPGAHFDDQLSLLDAMVDAAVHPDENRPPEAIAAGLVRALVPDPDQADDDVCLLVVRRLPVAELPCRNRAMPGHNARVRQATP